jgi:lysophospholipase
MTRDTISSLKGNLPVLQALSLDDGLSQTRFAEYFSLFGFEQAIALSDSYRFGALSEMDQIACHEWRVEAPRATVVVCHGLFDHAGLYLKLVCFLLEQKANVVLLDLPEHGLSEGRYGELDNFERYSDALSRVLCSEQFELHKPIFGIGQSTGCAVITDYCLRALPGPRFDRLVYLAPLLRPRAWGTIRTLYWLLGWCLKKVARGPSNCSHDSEFRALLEHLDPLQPDYVSVNWVAAMLKWERGFDAFPCSDIPLAIVQGTADTTVQFKHNIPRYKTKFTDLNEYYIEGAMHHLAGEADHWREQVFAGIAKHFEWQV